MHPGSEAETAAGKEKECIGTAIPYMHSENNQFNYNRFEREKKMIVKRKYELSEEELRTLIFMAASRVCDKQELDERDQGEICENAASIAMELISHLNGEEPFDPTEIEIADKMINGVL